MYNKKKATIVLILMLCATFLLPFNVVAEPVMSLDGSKYFVANEAQLDVLNSLQGKNVTYGEVIRTVYPEALKYIPEDELKTMDIMPMKWLAIDETVPQNSDTKSQLNETEEMLRLQIVIGHESNISNSGSVITYDSGSRVWLPNPYYEIPYMAALSQVKSRSTGSVVSSSFNCDSNCYDISSPGWYINNEAGDYRTEGYHYGTHTAGYQPPNYAFNTSTSWRYVP